MARSAVDDRERADECSIGEDRSAGVEADVRRAGYQRVRRETDVECCVGDDDDIGLIRDADRKRDGRRNDRDVPAARGLDGLAGFLDEPDERHGNVGSPGCLCHDIFQLRPGWGTGHRRLQII